MKHRAKKTGNATHRRRHRAPRGQFTLAREPRRMRVARRALQVLMRKAAAGDAKAQGVLVDVDRLLSKGMPLDRVYSLLTLAYHAYGSKGGKRRDSRKPKKLDRFTRSYMETALSTDDEGRALDDEYDVDSIAPETQRKMAKEARVFQRENREALDESGLDDDRAGHDFWLTRNRHGAGYWDEGIGEAGRQLTDAAHGYGKANLYVGDDGKLHQS